MYIINLKHNMGMWFILSIQLLMVLLVNEICTAAFGGVTGVSKGLIHLG